MSYRGKLKITNLRSDTISIKVRQGEACNDSFADVSLEPNESVIYQAFEVLLEQLMLMDEEGDITCLTEQEWNN